jgi:hypothetical protein
MTRLKGNNAENQAQQEAATVEDVSEEAQPAENEDPYVVRSEIRGDKNVHGFWKHGRTCMRRFSKITRRRKRGCLSSVMNGGVTSHLSSTLWTAWQVKILSILR